MFFYLESAHRICKVLIDTLLLEWQQKLKRQILLITLSNIFIEHPYTYESIKKDNILCFIISKLKNIQLHIAKQLTKNSVCII